MPTVRKRGDLQWQAIVKRQGIGFASKTFTTRKDAEAWAKITEAEMLRGAYISRRDAEKIKDYVFDLERKKELRQEGPEQVIPWSNPNTSFKCL